MPYRVLKCNVCSLVFVDPHPDAAETKNHYDIYYYQEWMSEQKRKRLRMWEKRFKRLSRHRSTGKLLDVGCGDGTFLSIALRNGWQIAGTEISEFAAGYVSGRLKTDIFNGDLLAAEFGTKSFDVVTMWHVLEHVENPMGYLLEIKRILKPDGLLLLAVPNVDNRLFQMAYRVVKGREMKLFTIGEKEIHLYHFSNKTIKKYLRLAGFDCIKLTPDYGIINVSKKIINVFAVIFYYLFGMHLYDAMDIVAVHQNTKSDQQ